MTSVHVAAPDAELRAALEHAVRRGGGRVVELIESPDALVGAVGPGELGALLDAAPSVQWVQLGGAGIEAYADLLDRPVTWTSAKGAYAQPVAEHALLLALASLRDLTVRARATSWGTQSGRSLHGLRCVVVGGGGIGAEIARLLAGFDTTVTVVRRTPTPVAGADRVVSFDGLDAALGDADVLFLAAALTPETRGMIGAQRLAAMPRGAVIVNIARGGLLDTDALAAALDSGQISAAGLDVTDPEPLPAGHALWTSDRVLVTPHTADTPEMIRRMLGARVEENVRRWADGMELVGVVDPTLGY